MGMVLSKIQDHRSSLDKAKRWELAKFAAQNGVTEIDPKMPAELMRKILRARGLTRIPIPPRVLGHLEDWRAGGVSVPVTAPADMKVEEVNAEEDLEKQWQEQKRIGQGKPKTKAKNPVIALRQECKRRGIKIARTDRMADLKAKLDDPRNAPDIG